MVSQDARCSAYRYLMSLICFSYLRKSVLWESQVHKHSVTNRWHSGVLNAFSEEGRSELRVNDWEVEKVEKAERKVEERYGSVCSTCFHSLWSHTLAPPNSFPQPPVKFGSQITVEDERRSSPWHGVWFRGRYRDQAMLIAVLTEI